MVNFKTFAIGSTLFLSACATALPSENVELFQGPSVTSVNTPYDSLLACIAPQIDDHSVIGVGRIGDETGKFTNSDGGNGSFVTQAAGDMVQSALMSVKKAGGNIKIVNRRDPRVMQLEASIGRVLKWTLSDYYITGSINSLDFIPGGGAELTVAGIGGKYRQYRMLVGMDLFLTNTLTSEVVASSSVQKQIVADDYGIGVGRFFGSTLVELNLGEQRREAVNFALREMLKASTYELLAEANNTDGSCQVLIDNVEGVSNSDSPAS